MPEPLTITVITAISGLLGVGAKGWGLYRRVKADTLRSKKQLLVQLARSQKSGFLSREGDAEKAIHEVYNCLTEAKPFVRELYRKQLALPAGVVFLTGAALVLLAYLEGRLLRASIRYDWILYLTAFVAVPGAFVLSWRLSGKFIVSFKDFELQNLKELVSTKSLASSLRVLSRRSKQLIQDTRKQFAVQPRSIGLVLSDFEAAFLRTYLELSGLVRSLELQALFLGFRKSSEALNDYLSDHIITQICETIAAMVERHTLKPKPQIAGTDLDSWQAEQKGNLEREFAISGTDKYLKTPVDESFWSEDFVQLSRGSREALVVKMKSWFPSFAEK